jgi:hypothetical protein
MIHESTGDETTAARRGSKTGYEEPRAIIQCEDCGVCREESNGVARGRKAEKVTLSPRREVSLFDSDSISCPRRVK